MSPKSTTSTLPRPRRHRHLAAFGLSFMLGACTPGAPQEEGGGAPIGSGGSSPAATGGTSGLGGTPATPSSGGSAPAATGGTTAPAATGGTTAAGTGGSPAPATDAGGGEAPSNPSAPAPGPGDKGPFTCTSVYGINATGEWYKKGFENLVENDKWQLIQVHSAFIEKWADPNNDFWNAKPFSPCAQNSATPDRIIFVVLNFDYNTLEQFMPPLTATVKNLRMKHPGAKIIELSTFVRAPGNKGCPQREAKRSQIPEALDQAIAMQAAANPEVVRIAPKFEAKACNEFSGNPPHPSAGGGMAWAERIAAHYKGTAPTQ